MRIYVDESGDLAYSQRSTRHFVLALVLTGNEKRIHSCFRRVRKQQMRKGYHPPSEMKFNNTHPNVTRAILMGLVDAGIKASYLVLEKRRRGREDAPSYVQFYSLLAKYLILRHLEHTRTEDLTIVADKALSRRAREAFDEIVTEEIQTRIGSNLSVRIEHLDSHASPGIQAADFVAGAVFQQFERGNSEYLDILMPAIELAVVERK